MTRQHHLIGTAALLVGLAFAATDARAGDHKFYPGGACEHLSGGTFQRWAGTVHNTSTTQDLQVRCPLLRDDSPLTSATAKVFDRSSASDISCTLVVESISGSTITTNGVSKTTTGFDAAVKTLTWGTLSGGNYYYASCTIPKSSGGTFSHVVSFDINEN